MNYQTNESVRNFSLVLEIPSSAKVAELISSGQLEAYMAELAKQKESSKDEGTRSGRYTIKVNKVGGLYIAHPEFAQIRGGLNFNKFLLPAVEAICFNDNLRDQVRGWFASGKSIDTTYIAKVN